MVESHISRKTSEIWGTRPFVREPGVQARLFHRALIHLEDELAGKLQNTCIVRRCHGEERR